MVSIHDSLLTGYVVDGRERSITLHTEPHPGGGEAFVDVVFRGVVAYHLEGDCFGNVVFGIEEVDPRVVVGDGRWFAEQDRQYGWPVGRDSRVETPEQFFDRVRARVFELTCSYGLGGWIAAASMESAVVEPPA